jgi:FkbM family methyltransferase
MRRYVKAALARVGYELHRPGMVPSWDAGAESVAAHGLTPATVFDIGVADGTPWLYATFPSAEYHLIDPTRESLPYMQAIARRLKATIHNIALGESESEMEIEVQPQIGGSSILKAISDRAVATRYSVPVRRLDDVLPDFKRPALLKIDVQGAEGMVLRGAQNTLRKIDCAIVETSIIALQHGATEALGILQLMHRAGLVLYDIAGLIRRPLDGALAYADFVFVPDGSPLRADRRWRAE